MNYPQSGKNIGPPAEQIRMSKKVRAGLNAAFVEVVVGGLLDYEQDELEVLTFPVWDNEDEYEEYEPVTCVICGGDVEPGGLYCRECGA